MHLYGPSDTISQDLPQADALSIIFFSLHMYSDSFIRLQIVPRYLFFERVIALLWVLVSQVRSQPYDAIISNPLSMLARYVRIRAGKNINRRPPFEGWLEDLVHFLSWILPLESTRRFLSLYMVVQGNTAPSMKKKSKRHFAGSPWLNYSSAIDSKAT